VATATTKTDSSRRKRATEWRNLCREHLPGYDPWATAAKGERFDVETAQLAVEFFEECLVLIEGEKAGQPFYLEPWQRAIVGTMFGWKRADGLRRYREAFVYVPRKNGKTPLAAGIILYALFCDHEPGAQIYSAAAEREQAALVYRHAAGMIARQPLLDSRAKVYKTFKSIEYPAENSLYKALSAESETKHGFSSHMVVVDELHAQPNGDLVDVLQTSMGARREPLLIHITTADWHRPSVCNRKHDYATKVRDGVIEDSSFLPIIYEATAEDDWTDPEVWARCNPNLGVSVQLDYLERECRRAQNEPSYENTFKRLHLNLKTEQDVRWLQLDKWDRCDGQPVCEGPCWGGMDLSTTRDITAFVLVWRNEAGGFDVLPHFWIPEDGARQRERRDRVPYLTWANQKLLTLTPGNVIDYGYVRREIVRLAGEHDVQQIGFDPWNARQITGELLEDDGLPMVEVRQGFVSLNDPTKELERLVVAGLLRHGGNPVLRWMAGNVVVRPDPAGNIKPDKAKSTERIDGIAALVIALSRALTAGDTSSTYESNEMLIL